MLILGVAIFCTFFGFGMGIIHAKTMRLRQQHKRKGFIETL